MSGRAPSMKTPSPTYTLVPARSPPTGSRKIRTRVTPTSSSAQPVTGTEPASPVVPLSGVSKYPTGAADVPDGMRVRLTGRGPTVLAAPFKASVIVPFSFAASPGENRTDRLSTAVPLPEVGETTSHG